ncbi:MAG: ABC transporter ATP-binding protein [Bryobacterales bacterium]|nr:ABC transporter ATP-binding protein [Bryobacterales bacterium]
MSTLLTVALTVAHAGRAAVLDDLRLAIDAGESVGLAGRSGAGKSTIALAILGLHDSRRTNVSGSIQFEGEDLLRLKERDLRRVRGRRIGFVPQSPLASLNPVLTVGRHYKEAWYVHQPSTSDWKTTTLQTLDAVSLPAREDFLKLYPRQLSVGLAQRVLIGLAILHSPALLIADEPTSALDLVTRGEILALLNRLNRERSMAMLHISHDLPALAASCRRLAVLAGGRIIEEGATHALLRSPQHAETNQLVQCLRTMTDLLALDALLNAPLNAPLNASPAERKPHSYQPIA